MRRHCPPGIPFDSLPKIDIVLISHDHYDHMDLPSLLRLQRRYHPRIITGLGNPGYLASQGVQGAEQLDWWQSASLGARRAGDGGAGATLVGAHAVRPVRAAVGRIRDRGRARHGLFRGRHRMGADVRASCTRDGAGFTLALLPVAPFRPRWYMARKHLSPGRCGARRDRDEERNGDPDSLGDIRAWR